MLTDEQIEQILYKYTSRQDEFNLSEITVIADRLSRIADFDNLYTLDSVSIIQKDIEKMNNIHKKYVEQQLDAIEDDFWWLVAFAYAEASAYYENQVALKSNKEIYNATTKLIHQAQNELRKLLKNPVFVVRDLKNHIVLLSQRRSIIVTCQMNFVI